MNGLFLFLPTIVIPVLNDTYRVFFLLPLLKSRATFVIDPPLILILTIVVLSQLNLLLGHLVGIRNEAGFDVQHLVAFNILTPLAYWISQQLRLRDFKVFAWLFALDAVFVVLQSGYGVSTFYTSLHNYEVYGTETGLLYFSRPFGLGNNASVFSEKLLIFAMILHLLKARSKFTYPLIVLALIVLAGILNLGRAALLSIMIFLVILGVRHAAVNAFRASYLLKLIVVLVVLSVFFTQTNDVTSTVIDQFLRGRQQIELAGREEIWADFMTFIVSNPVMGNASVKYFTDYYGNVASGHNSFLMIAATHGLIITFLYCVLILICVNRTNYIYIIPILVFSGAQYSIFWGLSFSDIVLFYFLRLGNKFRYSREIVVTVPRFSATVPGAREKT